MKTLESLTRFSELQLTQKYEIESNKYVSSLDCDPIDQDRKLKEQFEA
jgi:hypothetical protein